MIRCCPDLPLRGSPAPLLSIDQDLPLRGSPAPLLSVDQDWKATVVRLIFYEKKVEVFIFKVKELSKRGKKESYCGCNKK
nr:uncharacterized protein LOC113730771 isoform X8 [Coffea arabica]XP_027114560.1 uncharacterized protein LOC113732785 isoform X8 [Coffea arabica]